MPKRKRLARKQRLKNSYDRTAPAPAASLEAQLDQALKDDRPAFVFVQQRKHPDRQLERARARHPHRF